MADQPPQEPAVNYRRLLEVNADAIVIIDLDGVIVFESPAIEKITGVKPNQRVGKSVFENLHSEEIPSLKQLLEKLKNGKENSIAAQFRVKNVNGEWRWVESRGTVFNDDPNTKTIILSVRDISTQKNLELELKSSYQVLSSIYSQTSDALFYIAVDPGPTFRFLSANPAYYKISGVSEDRVVGKTVQAVTPQPSLALVISKYEEAIRTKKVVSWVETTTYPTWTKFAEIALQPIFDASGVCTNLVGSIYDITPLKEAERELISQQQELLEKKAMDEAILNSVGDGLVVVDRVGVITFVNEVGQKLLGWKSEELIGKKYSEAWNVKDISGNTLIAQRPITAVLSSGVPLTSDEFFVERRDHATFPLSVTVSPILEDGKVIGAVAVFRDITREKAIDNIKTEFVRLASHQLRTPLSGLRWSLELLDSPESGQVTEKQKGYIESCSTLVIRMINIVNALLVVNKIDLGVLRVEPQTVLVAEIAQAVLTDFKKQIADKKIILSEKYDPQTPTLQADPELVRIILENLLSNAVRYTPEGGKVELETTLVRAGMVIDTQTAGADSLLIRVSDTGPGIPESERTSIFSKLFRSAKVADFENSTGAGMGLYIVKSIVDIVGGKVWFNSTEGKGSTFFVLFPISGMQKRSGEALPRVFSIEKAFG